MNKFGLKYKENKGETISQLIATIYSWHIFKMPNKCIEWLNWNVYLIESVTYALYYDYIVVISYKWT